VLLTGDFRFYNFYANQQNFIKYSYKIFTFNAHNSYNILSRFWEILVFVGDVFSRTLYAHLRMVMTHECSLYVRWPAAQPRKELCQWQTVIARVHYEPWVDDEVHRGDFGIKLSRLTQRNAVLLPGCRIITARTLVAEPSPRTCRPTDVRNGVLVASLGCSMIFRLSFNRSSEYNFLRTRISSVWKEAGSPLARLWRRTTSFANAADDDYCQQVWTAACTLFTTAS